MITLALKGYQELAPAVAAYAASRVGPQEQHRIQTTVFRHEFLEHGYAVEVPTSVG
jgi:hypothetical protein